LAHFLCAFAPLREDRLLSGTRVGVLPNEPNPTYESQISDSRFEIGQIGRPKNTKRSHFALRVLCLLFKPRNLRIEPIARCAVQCFKFKSSKFQKMRNEPKSRNPKAAQKTRVQKRMGIQEFTTIVPNEPTSLGSKISGSRISDYPGTAVTDRRYSVFTKRTHHLLDRIFQNFRFEIGQIGGPKIPNEANSPEAQSRKWESPMAWIKHCLKITKRTQRTLG
jgi:hypothetical protein